MTEQKSTRKSGINYQRILVRGVIAGLILSFLLQAAIMLADPLRRTASDYMAFYAAGHIYQQYGMPNIYNLDLQRAAQQTQISFPLGPEQVLLYNHLPYLVPFIPIIHNDYILSFIDWMLILALVSVISLDVLANILPEPAAARRTATLAAFVFLPVYAAIVNGQDTPFLLLGAAIFAWGMLGDVKHETSAGIGLSLLSLRPQLAIFFLLPLLFWSRRAFRAYIAFGAAMAAVSLALIERQGALDFIHLLQITAGGSWFALNESAMFNLLGLALRAFPGLPLEMARYAAWFIYTLAGLGVALVAALRKTRGVGKQFALALVIALFLVPHLHFHDLALLLVPLFILIREDLISARLRQPGALVLALISLGLYLANTLPLLHYLSAYLLMLALAAGLLWPQTPTTRPVMRFGT